MLTQMLSQNLTHTPTIWPYSIYENLSQNPQPFPLQTPPDHAALHLSATSTRLCMPEPHTLPRCALQFFISSTALISTPPVPHNAKHIILQSITSYRPMRTFCITTEEGLPSQKVLGKHLTWCQAIHVWLPLRHHLRDSCEKVTRMGHELLPSKPGPARVVSLSCCLRVLQTLHTPLQTEWLYKLHLIAQLNY